MLRVIPHVAKELNFALKGGSAINLFVQDLPRLSVDIDLTHEPIEPRNISLTHIGEALGRIADAIKQGEPRWEYMGIAGIDKLPAIRWKLLNIGKMSKKKHLKAVGKLKVVLGL